MQASNSHSLSSENPMYLDSTGGILLAECKAGDLEKGMTIESTQTSSIFRAHSLHVPPFRRLSMVFQCSFILFFIFLACKVCWNSALSVQTTGPIGAEAYELNRQPTSKTPMLHSKRRFQHSRVQ